MALYRSMNSPQGPRLGSAGLEGQVGEVVCGEPKTLMCRVRPQHGHDRLAREATNECDVPRRHRQGGGVSGSGEGVPDDGLRRPSVDEAEGAEEHGGPGSQ
jgi:hypothetical protein